MSKYLDGSGVSYLWNQIKAGFAIKAHAHDAATQSAAGMMSAADKAKLDGVAEGATAYRHPQSGAAAGAYGPTANASPDFGDTIQVPCFTVDENGHLTQANSRVITLPSLSDGTLPAHTVMDETNVDLWRTDGFYYYTTSSFPGQVQATVQGASATGDELTKLSAFTANTGSSSNYTVSPAIRLDLTRDITLRTSKTSTYIRYLYLFDKTGTLCYFNGRTGSHTFVNGIRASGNNALSVLLDGLGRTGSFTGGFKIDREWARYLMELQASQAVAAGGSAPSYAGRFDAELDDVLYMVMICAADSNTVEERMETAKSWRIDYAGVEAEEEAPEKLHVLTLDNVDRVAAVGDSYTASDYSIPGKAWICKLSERTDFNLENFAVSGDTYRDQLSRIWAGTGTYTSAGLEALRPSHAILICKTNDVKLVSEAQYQEDLLLVASTLIGMGVVPIIATEYHVSNAWGTPSVFLSRARELGCYCVDLTQRTTRLRGADYAPFWGGSHPGTRSNNLFADAFVRFFEGAMPRPYASLKVFRPRSADASLDDLRYTTCDQRAARWKEISVGHRALNDSADYDACTDAAHENKVYSEYDRLRRGDAVSFANRCLIEAVLPATARDISGLTLSVEKSAALTCYVLDAMAEPHPAVSGTAALEPSGECGHWVPLTTFGAVPDSLLTRAVAGDKVKFLLVGEGEFTITKPQVSFTGDITKRRDTLGRKPMLARRYAQQLLTNPLMGTGWTWAGSPALAAPADGCLPSGCTQMRELAPGQAIAQSFSYSAPDPCENVHAKALVWARYFPPIFDKATMAYPADAAMTEDTFDYAALECTLNIETGTASYTAKCAPVRRLAGTHWNELEYDLELPSGFTSAQITLSPVDKSVQIAKGMVMV